MNTPSQQILIVDDDPGMIQSLARIIAGVAQVRFATNGDDALRVAREAPPDLVLLDAEMPGLNGFDVCAAIKADPVLAHVPVVFVTSHSEASFEIGGFRAGAADFIAKPVDPQLTLVRVQAQLRVKAMADELRRVSRVDALTQLLNRRAFDETLALEWRRGVRSTHPLSLLLVDIDEFKRYNDHYGHPAGDACLRAVAGALAEACLRPADRAYRYGGEEFAVVLPQTPREGAEHVARRLLEAVEELEIPHAASTGAKHVTVSIGIGCYDADSPCWMEVGPDSRFMDTTRTSHDVDELIAAADQALYAAKRHGRAHSRFLYMGHAIPASVEDPSASLRREFSAGPRGGLWIPGSTPTSGGSR